MYFIYVKKEHSIALKSNLNRCALIDYQLFLVYSVCTRIIQSSASNAWIQKFSLEDGVRAIILFVGGGEGVAMGNSKPGLASLLASTLT